MGSVPLMLGPPLLDLPPAAAGAGLGRLIEGWWSTTVSGVGEVVPDGAVDLLAVTGSVPFLAGPDRAPRPVGLRAGARLIGLRLRPGVASTILADGLDRAVGCQVDLAAVWPRAEVERLVDDLGRAGPDDAAGALAAAVARRVPDDWQPDPAVMVAVAAIRLDPAGAPLGRAGDLGDGGRSDLGDRQLRRRFTAAMGYGPAFYRRVLRLDRFTDLLAAEPSAPLADLAVAAGYYDQAHLGRDCRQLLGTTPARLRSAA